MLRTVTLDGFRCFGEPTRVELSGLTVLAGANNVGKSSIIHALVALVQAEQQQSRELLPLVGEWVDLGSFQQVLNQYRSGAQRYFQIGLTAGSDSFEQDVLWTFGEQDDAGGDMACVQRIEAWRGGEQLELEVTGRTVRARSRREPEDPWDEGQAEFLHPGRVQLVLPQEIPRDVRLLPSGVETVLYLAAYRTPPRRVYPKRRSLLGPLLGSMGEHTAEVLYQYRLAEVDVLPAEGSPVLFGKAVDAWWSHLFEGSYSIRPEPVEGPGVRLSINTPSAENLGLGQVGVGLSQALPILTLGLCSKPGQIIIIESPEVHLHPAAQHRLCDLFVELVRRGRQVVLETHSDHLINALRIAVKQKRLTPEQVALYSFSQSESRATAERLHLDRDGRLAHWPVGFFDQASLALLELMK